MEPEAPTLTKSLVSGKTKTFLTHLSSTSSACAPNVLAVPSLPLIRVM